MENFTEEEIKAFTDMEAVKEMINILDNVLDGETYHVRASDTDITLDNNLKPILPKGLKEDVNAICIKNKSIYAFTLQILIALLLELNPNTTENEDDYMFRIAIITDAISMGSIFKNKNWIESDITFDNNYIKKEGRGILEKNINSVKKVQSYLDAAHHFLAFSTMNMVRFNHHFPYDKAHLILKSLLSLPEEQRDRIMNEEKFQTFYDLFVTAARISNDKIFYEKYLLKKETTENKFFFYPILGIYKPNFSEEIITIRKDCTPNSFLILDIVNEIVNDLKMKKLLFLVPYQNQLASLLNIRNYIRNNPFGFHPAKNFYKCKAKNFEEVYEKFHTIMKDIGSFIFEYSENMYESVRSAKCRKKYQKNIKKDDEVLVRSILEIANVDTVITDDTKDLLKKKLYTMKYEVNEETNISDLNSECIKNFDELVNENIFN